MFVKKLMLFFLGAVFAVLLNSGCSGKSDDKGGKISVVCGLPPTAFIASEIGGERVAVSSMLPEGRSPHDYAPRPADIRRAGGAAFFFTTGMNFEKNAVRALPEQVRVINVASGIRRRHFDDGHGCCDGHGADHDHSGEEALDPHVWLSPANAILIARTICDALISKDPAHAGMYRKNFERFKEKCESIDARSRRLLSAYAGREFLVYHPAFGYFADAYKLRQHPLEINGREMTAVQLANVISKAQKENIKVVFVQPQFNPRIANELARRINGAAVPLDPLAYDLVENFRLMADAICRGFGGNK